MVWDLRVLRRSTLGERITAACRPLERRLILVILKTLLERHETPVTGAGPLTGYKGSREELNRHAVSRKRRQEFRVSHHGRRLGGLTKNNYLVCGSLWMGNTPQWPSADCRTIVCEAESNLLRTSA